MSPFMFDDDFPNAGFYNTKGQNNGKIPKAGDKVRYWDYDFIFTEEHLTPEQCEPLRQSYDVLADEALQILRRIQKEEAEKAPDADEKEVVERQEDGEKDASISEGSIENMKAETQKPEAIPLSPQDQRNSSPDAPYSCPFAGSNEEKPASHPEQPKASLKSSSSASSASNKDLLSLLLTHHQNHATLQKFYSQSTSVPDWVSWPQIRRGQEVFFRYAGPMFVGLTFTSLLGGLGGWRVVETLARTGGFSTKVARKRLYETTQFVLEVMGGQGEGVLGGLESLMPPGELAKHVAEMGNRSEEQGQAVEADEKEDLLSHDKNANQEIHKDDKDDSGADTNSQSDQGGVAWRSAIRVRLLHASVRRRILTLAKSHPKYYSTDQSGIPINDLHAIGTISTFAPVLLFGGLPRQGIHPSDRECEDFIALWRLVSYYIGCPDSVKTQNGETFVFYSSSHAAKITMQSMLISEVNPSAVSRALAHNIVECLVLAPPAYPSRSFLVANARWCNGNTICDALGLERPGFGWKILVAGQCLFFVGSRWGVDTLRRTRMWVRMRLRPKRGGDLRSATSVDEGEDERLKRVRRLLWSITVTEESGLGGRKSGFEFKWVPQLGLATGKEDRSLEEGGEQEGKGSEGAKGAKRTLANRRRERRAVVVVASALLLTGLLAWVVVWGSKTVLTSMLRTYREMSPIEL